MYLSYVTAPDRAAGAGSVSSGVHDEVFPRDQREGGDEEDHWSLWPDRKTAGGNENFFQGIGNGKVQNYYFSVCSSL